MADNWEDSGDDWDNSSDDDEELDKRLGLINVGNANTGKNKFDDEEDLAVKEKEQRERNAKQTVRTKGNSLASKKAEEKERLEEEDLARKVMEIESNMEENMTSDERRLLEKKRVEESDNALTDDLFSGLDNVRSKSDSGSAGGGKKANAGDIVIMKDLKDHLKHARKIGQCVKQHEKTHLASVFLKECIMECKDILDDDAVAELIKALNIIKNEKVASGKRKVKGQAQKSQKKDKAAAAKAKKIQEELYGKNDQFDNYDDYGAQYEDDFF